MTAKIEALRAPRQVSPWIVIGAAAALIAALAVLTVQESEVTPTARPPVAESVGAATSNVAEMAALKSAVAHRYTAEEFGVGEIVSSSTNEASDIWALKATIAREFLREQRADSEGPGSGSEKGHPVRRSG